MLADNLENILKVVGVNEFPEEAPMENGVFMDFHTDLFSFIQEGISNVSYLNNALRRTTSDTIICELREYVEDSWCRLKLTVFKGPSCRVSLQVLGKDTYTESDGFCVKG